VAFAWFVGEVERYLTDGRGGSVYMSILSSVGGPGEAVFLQTILFVLPLLSAVALVVSLLRQSGRAWAAAVLVAVGVLAVCALLVYSSPFGGAGYALATFAVLGLALARAAAVGAAPAPAAVVSPSTGPAAPA
jgi:hypothetical protein